MAQTRQAYVNAGEKAMESGDYYTAGSHFSKALEFDDNDASLLFKMAESSRMYNDYRNAAIWYEKYLATDKKNKNPLAVFHLGEMKKNTGAYPEAGLLFQTYYQEHKQDSDFYSLKSLQLAISCDTAIRLMHDSLPVKITNLGEEINSIYSDFGGQKSGDSVLYFSSQRFVDEAKSKKQKPSYVSKILKANSKQDQWQKPGILDRIINPSGYLNCNSSISADYRIMMFTRCTPLNLSAYHAEIYFSKWEKGRWSAAARPGKEINGTHFTSTHPCIVTNGAEGYILYFSSNRPGGQGGMDIWKSIFSNGNFSEPENLGPEINTQGDEVTPFFDNVSGMLYFSSDWHHGLGGFDIFSSKFVNGQYSRPVNIGYPLNSSTNDVYFTVQNNGTEGLLTSNRPGSMYIHSETCCYDIYQFEISPSIVHTTDTVSLRDSLEQIVKTRRITDSIALSTLLPLKLYFDNDEPGRKSTDTTTSMTYDQTYEAYISLKKKYMDAFKQGSKKNAVLQSAVDSFFTYTVQKSYLNLEKFASALVSQLEEGRKITMVVQGTASPLAKNDYNSKLSKRRISSLLNYLKSYRNGILNKFIENNFLVIMEDAAGETLAPKNVSDNLQDKQNSVYHPAAALERRIEVTSIHYDN
jgi:tetratricopeptide (TPR) repeat protein